MAYRDVVLADSPVDFYEMETSTGTDSGSGGRTLTLTGGITTDVPGLVGDGWSFDGVNDTASMATWPTLTTAFTFEAWVKPNLSGVSDTPTVIRRDGTDVMLLRVRGSALGVNPGQAEVYADGLTLLSTSSYRVDDGNWHHLVYTQSGNAAKLYVDGVQRASGTTTQSTFNMGTGTGYIGSANGTGEWYKGVMDNAAIYNTALSAARVTAHYDAGAPVNDGYAAQAMTASAAFVAPVINYKRYETVYVTDDAKIDSAASTTNYGSDNTLSVSGTSRALIKSTTPSLGEGESIIGGKLVVFRFGGGTHPAGTLTLRRNTSDWSESTVTYATIPSSATVGTVNVPETESGDPFEVDISSILTQTNYGLQILNGTSEFSVHTSEALANLRPYIVYEIQTPSPANFTASPFAADASMPTATGTGGTGVSPTIDPMTANAELGDAGAVTGSSANYTAQPFYVSAMTPDATVEVISNIDVDAEPMDASADLTQGGGFASPNTVAAEVFTASAETVDVVVETQQGPNIAAAPMVANSVWKQAASVNGVPIVTSEVDDKFFQRVMAVPPLKWWRLNSAGSQIDDRISALNTTDAGKSINRGYAVGVQTGQNNGPDGRGSFHFDGSAYLRQDESVGVAFGATEAGPANSTLEFSFSTEKADQFIMVSSDLRQNTANNSFNGTKELHLKDGRITYRTYTTIGTYTEFTGFRNLADGEWHTIVIRSTDTSTSNSANIDGVEIFIDGKFEIRRSSEALLWTGFPDYIGSRPAILNAGTTSLVTLPTLPSSQNFEGDMSEVVFFGRALDEYEITRHYYDFMAWNPIEASSMDAFAFTPADSRGRGNQKRALYLWWDREIDFYGVAGENQGLHNTMNFDPVLDGHGNYGTYNLEGYKVFSRGVQFNTDGARYRDDVYDRTSLIDLDVHVDIEDYDAIFFGDWPDEGYEEDALRNNVFNYTAQKERLINQIHEANAKGVGLMVTHPRLAVDLGIIDRVEFVSTLKESKGSPLQGNAAGLYDYGSAVKFPWNMTADAGLSGGSPGADSTGQAMNTDPAYLSSKAFYFEDMNFNNKFRVRALVDGLTNIPSYIIKDAAYHVDSDLWGDDFGALNLEDRRDGLVIGDEFIFHGTNAAHFDWSSSYVDGLRLGRAYGYYAAPVANVKAGTVVTTFGATHYKDQSQIENPYKDYATTIVLDSGDVLAGRAVGGRIFVSFTEQPNRFESTAPADILPGSEWDDGSAVWPNGYTPDTAAQRDWEFSGTREAVGNTSLGGKLLETSVTMPDGSIVVTRRPSGSSGLIAANYVRLFGVAWLPRWDMTRRGMWWVGRGERPAEGDLRVAATPMTADAVMPEPVVVAQRDAGYTAEPMRALAQMTRVAESTIGDVEIRTLPWTAEAGFTGFSRVISAGPMEASAEFVENFDMVHASGEQVVLTLHGVDATLYLKEEA